MDQVIVNVQPIRSTEILKDMKWSLKRHCGERDYILFLIGINTGLRIGDILKLKVSDVKDKKSVLIKEGKTNKRRTLHLSNIYTELNDYVNSLDGTGWLFPSRKGDGPITRIQAYRQLNKAAEMIGINEGIGTHTMRKTFGYWFYKKTKDVAQLQMILNHATPEITKQYIGITAEEIEESLANFSL